ncbi:MAG: DUF1698 domain-containing protein [Bryobacteraceae bacterium]
MAVAAERQALDLSKGLYETGFYHSFELPDSSLIKGCIDLEFLRKRWAWFGLPDDLRGARVLDIGAWDGWFSFEAARRGADVTAIDCVEIPNFLAMRERLGVKVDYRVLDFYEIPQAKLGKFDFVLFLGVLYHLKHPLLALEIVCEHATEMAIVDSFVIDGDTWRESVGQIPMMEFYETDELGTHFDNWIGPSVTSLEAMCRAAGFARVEMARAAGNNAVFRCWRRPLPAPTGATAPPPKLRAAIHARNTGINFTTGKEEYISCWFESARETIGRNDLIIDVSGYGVPTLYTRSDHPGVWTANFRVPLGLAPGWHDVKLRFPESQYSNAVRIAMDIPPQPVGLSLVAVCGAHGWTDFRMTPVDNGFLCVYVKGLSENCDRNNLRVMLGGKRIAVDFIAAPDENGVRQINVAAGSPAPGPYQVHVEFGGVVSNSLPLQVE